KPLTVRVPAGEATVSSATTVTSSRPLIPLADLVHEAELHGLGRVDPPVLAAPRPLELLLRDLAVGPGREDVQHPALNLLDELDLVLDVADLAARHRRDLVDQDPRLGAHDALVAGLQQDAAHRGGHAARRRGDVVACPLQLLDVVVQRQAVEHGAARRVEHDLDVAARVDLAPVPQLADAVRHAVGLDRPVEDVDAAVPEVGQLPLPLLVLAVVRDLGDLRLHALLVRALQGLVGLRGGLGGARRAVAGLRLQLLDLGGDLRRHELCLYLELTGLGVRLAVLRFARWHSNLRWDELPFSNTTPRPGTARRPLGGRSAPA